MDFEFFRGAIAVCISSSVTGARVVVYDTAQTRRWAASHNAPQCFPMRRPMSKPLHEPEARFLHRCLSTRRDEQNCLEEIRGQAKSCRGSSAGVGRQLAESPKHTSGGRCRTQYRRHAAPHGVIRRSTVSNSIPPIRSAGPKQPCSPVT